MTTGSLSITICNQCFTYCTDEGCKYSHCPGTPMKMVPESDYEHIQGKCIELQKSNAMLAQAHDALKKAVEEEIQQYEDYLKETKK